MNQNYSLLDLPKIAQEITLLAKHKTLLFFGEMGVGKTTLIKALCKQLEVQDNISSPTFSLVNEYHTKSNEKIYHFDFYRIKDEEEAIRKKQNAAKEAERKRKAEIAAKEVAAKKAAAKEEEAKRIRAEIEVTNRIKERKAKEEAEAKAAREKTPEEIAKEEQARLAAEKKFQKFQRQRERKQHLNRRDLGG